jgi:probable rRNA maturation factor
MIDIDPPSSPLEASLTISKPSLARFLERARLAVGLAGEVNILITSDAEIRRLNRTFRGKNKPTDILSFPAPEEVPGLAGDLAISIDTAARQADHHGHSLEAEIRILVLHGLLHLAGEDHETDAGQMAAREARLRRRFKLPATLIERAAR